MSASPLWARKIEAIRKAAKGDASRRLANSMAARTARLPPNFVKCTDAVQRSDVAMLIVSIALEAAVAILAVLAARRGKPYIYGLAFTFGAYVLYDLARLLHWNVQAGILSWLFLLATISALIAVWGLYRKW
jgi:hypothetical protein